MELSQIRHFVAVMQAGSFTAAADLCGISQPGLTKSIRALERELGGKLFHREGNRLLMSELGRTMAPVFRQMSEQAHLARQTAESFQVLRTSSLKLGVINSIGGVRLARQLAEFHSRYPGTNVEIHHADSDEIAMRLDHGELDFAIMNSAQHERGRHRAELLYRERYVAAFGPGHRFESLERVSLADLMNEPYVDRLSCELRKQFQQLCRDRSLELFPAIRSQREDWTQELVVSGFGCAILPEFSIRHPLIQTRPFVDPEILREVSLICVRGRQLSNPALRLRKMLKETATDAHAAAVASGRATAASAAR